MRTLTILIIVVFFFPVHSQVTAADGRNNSRKNSKSQKKSKPSKSIKSANGDPLELISEAEKKDLIGLIINSLDYYLDRAFVPSQDQVFVRRSEEQIFKDLKAIVKDIELRYDYHVDEQFPGFSDEFMTKAKGVMSLNWDLLPENEENGTADEQRAVAKRFSSLQIKQLKAVCRNELEEYVGLHVYRLKDPLLQGQMIEEEKQENTETVLAEVAIPLRPYDFHIYKQEVVDIGIYDKPDMTSSDRNAKMDALVKESEEQMKALNEQLLLLQSQVATLKQQATAQDPVANRTVQTTTVDSSEKSKERTRKRGVKNATRGVTVKKGEVEKALPENSSYTFRFAKNSDELSYSDKIKLIDVAIRIIENPDLEVKITGFADLSGTPELNARISKARAEAVEQYLRSRYVAADRLIVNYMGASQSGSENSADRKVEVALCYSK